MPTQPDPSYLALPIEVDADTVYTSAVDYLKQNWPGWEPAIGNLDAWILRAWASEAAELRELASQVPTTIFRYYGDTVVNIPPVNEAEATVNSTWTAKDNSGYTIDEGTQVGIPAAGDEVMPFLVVTSVTIPPGSTATAAGEVQLVAAEAGSPSSGLGSAGFVVQLIDPLDWVSTITLTAATTGGVDAEDDDVYLARLAQELTLMAPRPILPGDFAILAHRVAGVHRVAVIDNTARTVTLALIDVNGNEVSGAVQSDVQALLAAMREVNFVINIAHPAYTPIDVNFTATTIGGYDPPTVIDEAEANVADYLSPANWGRDPYAPNPALDTTWVNNTTVRYLEVANVVNNTQGIDYISLLQMRKGAAAFAAADVALTGTFPLPQAGVIVGTPA